MSEPLRVEIAGEPLRCKHCDANEFHEESTALDRVALGGLLLLEGAWGHRLTVYRCGRCGYAHLFFAADCGGLRREEAEEAIECLSCGVSLPIGASSCPSCGWSWVEEGPRPT